MIFVNCCNESRKQSKFNSNEALLVCIGSKYVPVNNFSADAMLITTIGDTIIMSHKNDKQSQSLADANISLPKVRVRSHDCSILRIEKCKHLEC